MNIMQSNAAHRFEYILVITHYGKSRHIKAHSIWQVKDKGVGMHPLSPLFIGKLLLKLKR